MLPWAYLPIQRAQRGLFFRQIQKARPFLDEDRSSRLQGAALSPEVSSSSQTCDHHELARHDLSSRHRPVCKLNVRPSSKSLAFGKYIGKAGQMRWAVMSWRFKTETLPNFAASHTHLQRRTKSGGRVDARPWRVGINFPAASFADPRPHWRGRRSLRIWRSGRRVWRVRDRLAA